MADKLAERRRRRRERVCDVYRQFAKAFWTAYRDNDQAGMDQCVARTYNFRLGVAMADPNGRWYRRFQEVDREIMKDMGIEDAVERWNGNG